MNLPALNGKLKLKGKLKFRRKYNNKPPLPIFSLLLFQMSEAALSHCTHINAHCDHLATLVSLD